ncbi:Transcriptional regulator [Syntrophobacter sp. SbD1]|nr:Transcriptional regulator [Syntrophobacter sp. SbD1]
MPPGYDKIVGALKLLLKEKEFNAITWAEIARTAGVNEALIYKYFHDKRNLLYKVLRQYLEKYAAQVEEDLKVTSGALNKLKKAIRAHFNAYSQDRIFAKILILEVRNYPDYFESETYELVKHWANSILAIIDEGVRNGEIRSDISARHLRQMILGGIEHLCLPEIVFGREFSPDTLTEELCEFIFHGIRSAEE